MEKKIFIVLLLTLGAICGTKADKVQSTFWGSSFGATMTMVEEGLKEAEIEAKTGNSYVMITNAILCGVNYEKVVYQFSPIDRTFYKLVGSTKFEEKDKAVTAYQEAESRVREMYPNAQVIRHPEQAEKMCTYLDDDNLMYVALFKQKKEGKILYFLNTNYWNKARQTAIQEASR